jgi:hypothetical protein
MTRNAVATLRIDFAFDGEDWEIDFESMSREDFFDFVREQFWEVVSEARVEPFVEEHFD